VPNPVDQALQNVLDAQSAFDKMAHEVLGPHFENAPPNGQDYLNMIETWPQYQQLRAAEQALFQANNPDFFNAPAAAPPPPAPPVPEPPVNPLGRTAPNIGPAGPNGTQVSPGAGASPVNPVGPAQAGPTPVNPYGATQPGTSGAGPGGPSVGPNGTLASTLGGMAGVSNVLGSGKP
jgi:hypothetical protein